MSERWSWLDAKTMRHLQIDGKPTGVSAPLASNRIYSREGREAIDGICRKIEALPLLLAYAECMEAFAEYYGPTPSWPDLAAVLTRHGYSGRETVGATGEWIAALRDRALAAARGGAE